MALLVITGCATGSRSGDSQTLPLIGDFEVHRFLLPNGLKLVVVEDHSSPTFAYQTWYDVGSRDEQPGKTGLAHLFEHMMFKETKTLKDGQFDKILEAAGAEGENAFTSRDYTAYVQELPVTQLDLIARLEADRMVNLLVNDKAFKTETEVVQNERRMRLENSPDGTLFEAMFDVAFTKHPYHWPVIGYQKDLDAMSAADARSFYKTFYSPSHATIAVVGDVKASQVLETVKKHYGALAASQPSARKLAEEPEQKSPRRKNIKLNMQVEKLFVSYHIPANGHPDMPAIDVLQSVLSGGKSSRLNRALVETGIASSVGSFDLDDQDPTLFMVIANLQKGNKAAHAESVLLREITRLVKEPPSAQELERAKNIIDFDFYEALNSNTEKASFLGKHETVSGGFENAIAAQKRIRDVTPADVQAVAKKYLDPKNRTVITGVPK